MGVAPGTKGKRSPEANPTTSAMASASTRLCSGISTVAPSMRISPVAASSIRSRSWRRIRKVEGTTPDAEPEWTPSVRMSTVRVPATSPRREVVSQSVS